MKSNTLFESENYISNYEGWDNTMIVTWRRKTRQIVFKKNTRLEISCKPHIELGIQCENKILPRWEKLTQRKVRSISYCSFFFTSFLIYYLLMFSLVTPLLLVLSKIFLPLFLAMDVLSYESTCQGSNAQCHHFQKTNCHI